jgi:mannose-6-phosphate isomerase-like protein (cupin superfamily)
MTQAFALGPGEGVLRQFPVERIEKITAEDSGGWAVAVETCPPGFEAPLHIQHTEDGAFFVLEGSIHMEVGDLRVEAVPGTFVFMPRGVPHAFKVTSVVPVRFVNIQGPTGDFQELIAASNELAEAPVSQADRAAKSAALSKRYGIELVTQR